MMSKRHAHLIKNIRNLLIYNTLFEKQSHTKTALGGGICPLFHDGKLPRCIMQTYHDDAALDRKFMVPPTAFRLRNYKKIITKPHSFCRKNLKTYHSSFFLSIICHIERLQHELQMTIDIRGFTNGKLRD